ncbi:MAG: hypothetical protein ACK4P4_02930 [Allorhizobium sp.]
MEVLNIRSPFRPQDIAAFDVQLGPHVRLYSLALRKLENGHYRVMAPKSGGEHVATFTPVIASAITKEVLKTLEGTQPNDRIN